MQLRRALSRPVLVLVLCDFLLCLRLQKLYILGGEVAESTKKCTHLIASKVTRTVKFLTAISVVKHIVTPEWLEECFKCQKFIGGCRAAACVCSFTYGEAGLYLDLLIHLSS